MSVKRISFVAIALQIGFLPELPAGRAQQPAAPAQTARGPLTPIQSFLGVCQADVTQQRKLGLGWDRVDAGWGPDLQHPVDDAKFEKQVRDAQAHGVTILPILCYTADWAGVKSGYEFDHKGIHYRMLVTQDASVRGGYRRVRIGVDPRTGKEVSRKELDGTRVSPDPAAWAAYVEALVSKYSKPPYNIKYWQIWNEGTMESGAFWDENVERYVENVHIPAAKIVHKYHCKVVWGGWPDCNSLAEYDRALLYHDAWKYTDILDVHYLPPVAFDYLYGHWLGSGRCEGIWMTEVGFTQNRNQIANSYPRMLYWALTHDFDDPDKYKVFWFAWWSPDDPKAYGYHCTLNSGNAPSEHGRQVSQIATLLDSPALQAYGQFTTDPAIGFHIDERQASVEGFQAGGRYVIAYHLPVTSSDHLIDWRTGDTRHMGIANRLTLTLPEIAGDGRKFRARVVPLPGADPYPADVSQPGRDVVVTFAAPIQSGETAAAPMSDERVFYVVVEPAP